MTSKTPGTPRQPTPQHRPQQGAPSAPFLALDDESSSEELESTAPCTPSPHLLSVAHQRFCAAYVSQPELNGTKAYQAVYPKASYDSARSESSRLLAKPNIQREIQRLMDERAVVTGITADRVLLRLWQMATADPRELVEVRIGCCRHCHGIYHQYQFTDSELELAETAHIHAEVKRRKVATSKGEDFEPKEFPRKGGDGYDPGRRPHPECPECGGNGAPQVLVKDTRDLSPGALMLFAGAKVDKNGNVNVDVRDQLAPLQLVGKHLGMWNGDLAGPPVDDPLTQLLNEIRGTSGTAAALPIVHQDPELAGRIPAQEVQDVTPKPVARKSAPGAPSAPSSPAWRPV